MEGYRIDYDGKWEGGGLICVRMFYAECVIMYTNMLDFCFQTKEKNH